ncbi:MAG: DUF1893 domain-containing protein [Clostridia bacterium]|nr:DUF1893 domain-containing protein [Clostridia bacterium]
MNLEILKKKLDDEQLTCVIADQDKILFTSRKRGVAPLVEFIGMNIDGEFFLADKVIGKAAAMLCIKANIKHVLTGIVSIPAITILKENEITLSYEEKVDRIKNRTGDGLCPMEGLSEGVTDINVMYDKVYLWLQEKNLL